MIMTEPVPEGFETGTYRHAQGVCVVSGSTAPVTVYVPVDKTGWAGVICGDCKQQLIEDKT